ncbi:30S ribosomal protein S13 [Candidatus Karelsulcia muelleri]|uniref:30S ribosomal protein S13 n=1 Tax=Candidatus Karelsulcia muelleri TaxID=336810 RepID=UPI001FF26488|nr:30S ribosomal protein S13 [Candidatus Karelsulcia muelleri]UOQ27798.1 30S ribosomal protein S13 [Candidatus Karelsulcia muelleri]
MALISGINIPENKRGIIALTYIFGIGKNISKTIFEILKMNPNTKVKNWSDLELNNIRKFINKNIKLEGELKTEIKLDIKRLLDIKCYRGIRHKIGLPVRGQKTKNNCRTRKGKRKTIANKKKLIKKS